VINSRGGKKNINILFNDTAGNDLGINLLLNTSGPKSTISILRIPYFRAFQDEEGCFGSKYMVRKVSV